MQRTLKKNSEIISLLRLPLIVGVVFIHSIKLSQGYFPLYDFCYSSITEGICQVCVPLFFFFSGYLFFQNVDSCNVGIYKSKIKRRISSLLIPFVFWNLFVVAIIGTGQILCPSLFSGAFKNVLDFDAKDWLSIFYCSLGTNKPIAYQLWFLRDLILLSAITPLFYCLCKYLKFWCIVALMVLYILGVKSFMTGMGFPSLFFYGAGCWFGINKRVFAFYDLKLRYVPIVACIVLSFSELLLKGHSCVNYIHRANVIVACITVLQLISFYVEKHDVSHAFVNRKSISNASFFIYCYHGIFATFVGKFAGDIVNNDFEAVIVYFAIVVFLVIFGILAYNVLLRTLPRFTGVITGGRN